MDSSFNVNTLTNKIVLVGYTGHAAPGTANFEDEDRFFTPLNSRLSGRSLPDMYGVIIQANIIRMALDKDYIFVFPTWLNFLFAFCLSWALMPLFVKWFVHKALWFHLFTMFFQLAISILFVYFTIALYAWGKIKIESSAVLVSVLLIGDFLSFYNHLIKFLKYKRKWNFHSKLFEGAH
jgi:CHASE2 domain-containing sensor protein